MPDATQRTTAGRAPAADRAADKPAPYIFRHEPLVVSTVTLGSGLLLSYAAQGDETGPVLVLLPGPTDSWCSYEPVLDQLSPAIRVVAVSERGHGDSGKPALGYGVEDFAADVVPLGLDTLSIERAVVAGHSGSCMVARRVAIDRPDRVAGLVLEASPTTLRGDAGLEGFVASIVAGLEDPVDPGLARSFVTDTSSDLLADDVLDRLVGELLKVPAGRAEGDVRGLPVTDDDLAEPGPASPPPRCSFGATPTAWSGAHAGAAGRAHPRRGVARSTR